MDEPPLQQALSRKESEYIDHDLPLQSLLAPTYIRDTNNYLIDFMESTPLVFPNKHVTGNNADVLTTTANAVSTTGSGGGGGYNMKVSDPVSLTPDLHFPNTIFHYRPTPNDVAVSNVSNVAEATLSALNTPTQTTAPIPMILTAGTSRTDNNATHAYSHNKHTQYITLNSDFLNDGGNKQYCVETEAVNQAGDDAAVQQFLLADANVSLDDAADLMNAASGDVLYARHVSNARKVLPHKKRISRKLRVSLSGVDNVLSEPPLGEVHKMQDGGRLNVSVYSCEICGNTSDSQLQFFAHLKQHYEPTTPDTILAAMKTSLEALEPQKILAEDKKSPNGNVDQVFNDVHLNFPDFTGVDESPIRHVLNSVEESNNEMKILNTADMSYVAQTATPPLKRTVEVEFSDSEDMLEGIRNVVDKVSIEDTCDALDLMTSNGMRGSWFTNDNFNGITFKNKAYSDVSFTEPLPPMPMMSSAALTRANQTSKEPNALPPAEKLLSYQKSDGRIQKMELQLPPDVDDDDDDVVDGGNDVVAEAANRATYYNDTLPPIHLPSVDADEQQLQCQSPDEPTTPTDLLEPLHVSQFDIPENANAQVRLENTQLTTVINSNAVEEDEEEEEAENVFCKEEPDTYDYEESEVRFVNYKSNQKKFNCTKCDRKFNSRNALKYHLRTHTGMRPHQCETCDKSFYALSALKAHTRTHTGDKPFKCEYCQRDFRQWGDLKYHVVSKHTEDKSHQCEYCGKAFSRKYSLVLHRRIHTSERNFKCEFCNKTFRASTYLQDHRKIHTGEKPNECTICSKRFRMVGDLRRHERIHQRADAKKATKSAKSGT
uniref:Zinc finger protein 501 n=1 Tax=Zeugodacus cucurbitae TaxID=28588 RepID=A0A0A1X402_ZEUCU